MRELLKNKKTLIPILIGVAIIVIAIVAFIIITVTNNDSDKRVSTIYLEDSQPTSNALGNTYGTDNEVENESSNQVMNNIDEEDVDFDIDDFYVEAVKAFIAGYQDESEMQKFIEDYFDAKAFVAYDNVEHEDNRFLEEYSSLSDEDEEIEKVKDNLLQFPETFAEITNLLNNLEEENDTSEEVDYTLILKDISQPEVSEDDENITKIEVTMESGGESQKCKMVFYGDVVIYIMDEDENSIFDSIQTN